VLNWLVLVPLIAAALLVPHIYLDLLFVASWYGVLRESAVDWVGHAMWIAGVVVLVGSMAYIALDLPSLGDRRWPQRRFLAWFLLPLCVTEMLLSASAAWFWLSACAQHSLVATVTISAAALASPGIVGLVASRRGWSPWTWMAVGIAGTCGGALLWVIKARHLMVVTASALGPPHCGPQIDSAAALSPILQTYVALDVPFALVLLTVEFMVLVGLSGRAMTDEDREWWARTGAWLLIVAVVWFCAAGLVFIAHPALKRALVGVAGVEPWAMKALLAAATLLSGGAASRSGARLARRASGRASRVLFSLAAPSFVVLLLLLVASVNDSLLHRLDRLGLAPFEGAHPPGGGLVEVLCLFGALVAFGLVTGRRVSVNIFSLHGMYRHRLVRTFVGASRPDAERRPQRFTGFDPADDVAMHALAGLKAPLHLFNCTINLVHGSGRAGQERKGAAFTVSPLHVGSRAVGYRNTREYAEGLMVGNAMTISGAAVAPQMGSYSSPLLTFLLTLFNARLGVWLGSPGAAGARTWTVRAPGLGPGRLLDEMFGQTSDASAYVYLTDGGHFENLGVYEMIARRCRTIVAVDAGCDPDYAFSDLGNLVRRARIDLGVSIEFADRPAMTAAGQGLGNPHAAIGRIRYSTLDPTLPDGVLVYLKATISGDEPVDVLNYAASHPAFPHDPTSNQWFAEAQFESYRVLGHHTIDRVCDGMAAGSDLAALVSAAERYLAASSPDRSARADARSPVSTPSVNLA
jgi:hypothetical protein